VALGNATTVSVTVLTGVASAGLSSRPSVKRGNLVWFATLLPVGLLAVGRTRRYSLGCFALLCCLIAVTGCGAGRAIPLETGSNPGPTPGPVTPAGTYNIVASAASGGLTRTVSLTLIVQ
jgi:hypothetical protein